MIRNIDVSSVNVRFVTQRHPNSQTLQWSLIPMVMMSELFHIPYCIITNQFDYPTSTKNIKFVFLYKFAGKVNMLLIETMTYQRFIPWHKNMTTYNIWLISTENFSKADSFPKGSSRLFFSIINERKYSTNSQYFIWYQI